MIPTLQLGGLGRPIKRSAGGGSDPHYASVVSLLNFQGPNGSTTFTDEKGKTWTAGGDAQINSNSGLFDGAGDYIFSAAHSDFTLGTGDYTAEAIINCGGVTPSGSAILSHELSGTVPLVLAFTSSGGLGSASGAIPFFGFYDGAWRGVKDPANAAVPITGDVHLAGVKQGTTYSLFVNGVLLASGVIAVATPTTSNQMRIARRWDASGSPFFNGRVKAVRLTKGVARYTAGFTPPTAPFPTS